MLMSEWAHMPWHTHGGTEHNFVQSVSTLPPQALEIELTWLGLYGLDLIISTVM